MIWYNIAIIKRILPLLIITGLLFGQASLLIESLLKELPEEIRLPKGKFVTEKECKYMNNKIFNFLLRLIYSQ